MTRCEFCDTPTNNGDYHGKTLCDDCIFEVDEFIERKIDERKQDYPADFLYESMYG